MARLCCLLVSGRGCARLCVLALGVLAGLVSGGAGVGCSGAGGAFGGADVKAVLELEPNDTFGAANVLPLAVNEGGQGTIGAGDVDYWSFTGAQGDAISLCIHATRFAPSAWNVANTVPRITIFDTDGTTELLRTDLLQWAAGRHDLDVTSFELPAGGTYFFRVSSESGAAGGGYVLAVQSVTLPQPVQTEVEPNDTFVNAQPITLGTMSGFYVDNSVDLYSFAITADALVTFEIECYRRHVHANDAYCDLRLTLIATDQSTVLVQSDDAIFNDPALSYWLFSPGTYFVRVEEQGGNGDAPYFLRYSSQSPVPVNELEPGNDSIGGADAIAYGSAYRGNMAPGDIDHYFFSGQQGDMLRIYVGETGAYQQASNTVSVQILSPTLTVVPQTGPGPSQHTIRAILVDTGTHYIRVQAGGGPTLYTIRPTLFRNGRFEIEGTMGNGTIATANTVSFARRASGVINPPGDVDMFSFTATSGLLHTVCIYAEPGARSNGDNEFSGHGSTLSPQLDVLDALGVGIVTSTQSLSNVSSESVCQALCTLSVSFVPTASGSYFVRVRDESPASGSLNHRYVIQVN